MAEAGAFAVPGYEVSGVLGQGGFGIVYRARQLAVEREVALKVDNRVLVSERDRRRFMREVTSAGALSGHPHVAHVYDAGVLPDGRPYMVLELCPGGSLLDRMRAEKRLPPAEVADIGIRIADALSAAHAAGVLHRDIKPANILINRYGNVVLSDFGLATMPSSGAEASVTRESLTPAYAPPEAFELTEPSAAGDVYSLAATLYALLSGRPPRFPESGVVNIAVIMALHRLPIPEIPGVPPELTAVLRAAMAPDPALRTPSVSALRDALTDLRLDRSVPGASFIPRPVASPVPPPVTPQVPPRSGRPVAYAEGHEGFSPPRAGAAYAGPAVRDVTGGAPARSHSTSPSLRGTSNTRAPGAVAEHTPPSNARVFAALAAAFVILLLVGIGLIFMENRDSATSPADVPAVRDGAAGDDQAAEAAEAAKDPGNTGNTGSAENAENAAPSTGASQGFGIATVTQGCPAARVAGAGAACPAKAECWGGLVSIAGDTTARRIDCTREHSWQTYAIAPLPRGTLVGDLASLEDHPAVRKVCSGTVMFASMHDRRNDRESRWHGTVLPPSQARFQDGVRVYRCLGGLVGRESSLSGFGR
ncbi:serine/threonine-protein kinase [Streptosporangium sp. NPDC050855]|uniref:serine/threonine-protein kinase n=1 Tax=Streptosporangium sp. NPDC050855 TaxID=3366194 RepID=UPI003797EB90